MLLEQLLIGEHYCNCKGRLHTIESTVLGAVGEHNHGPEIGKEEVFEFRNAVKRRAQVTHDNPHRIIAEASACLSESAKVLLPTEKTLKKFCKRMRPVQANPTSLHDLVMDNSLQTLGGKNFLIYDSGAGSDEILMFGAEENMNVYHLLQYG